MALFHSPVDLLDGDNLYAIPSQSEWIIRNFNGDSGANDENCAMNYIGYNDDSQKVVILISAMATMVQLQMSTLAQVATMMTMAQMVIIKDKWQVYPLSHERSTAEFFYGVQDC